LKFLIRRAELLAMVRAAAGAQACRQAGRLDRLNSLETEFLLEMLRPRNGKDLGKSLGFYFPRVFPRTGFLHNLKP
jgi:hypothetical protein